MRQAVLTEEQNAALKLNTIFDKYSIDKVGHFQPSIDTNPHTVIETILTELQKNKQQGFRELFELLSSQKFTNTCHQCSYALALLLKLQRFTQITLIDCYQIELPEKTNSVITKKEPEQKFIQQGLQYNPHCILGILINEVEYLVSPKHFIVQNTELQSTLEPESHLFKSNIYLRRIITDLLRENNKGWDSVAYPLWIKTGDEPKFYKAFSRTPLIIE